MDRDRTIEAYIQRLLAWEKPLNKNTLVAIAKEAGVTPAEMDAIKRQANAHFTRGRNYIEFGVLNEAIEELTQAVALDPLNLDILHALANTYNLRYNREHDLADRQQALMVAKRCVELKPNDKEALVLISFLEHTAENSQQKLSRWNQQKLTLLASGCITVGLAVIGISRLPIFSTPPPLLGPAPGTVVPGAAIYESSDSAIAFPSSSVIPANIKNLLADVDVPVIFNHPELVVEARLSQVGDYEDAAYYQMHGILINAGDQEVRKLNLNVEFLDAEDRPLAATEKEIVGTEDAIIRPGDTHAFNLIQKIDPELTTVRLSLINLEQTPARRTYVPPTPINYIGDSLDPDTISFELASRSEEFGLDTSTLVTPPDTSSDASPTPSDYPSKTSKTADGTVEVHRTDAGADPIQRSQSQDTDKVPTDTVSFNAEWVIINTNDYPIHELTLKTDFFNGDSNLLQSEEILAISHNDAPLLPGETRPFRVIESVDQDYERYKVTVLDAE